MNDANDHTLTFQRVYSGIGLASELVLSPARRKSFQDDRNVVKLWNDSAAALSRCPLAPGRIAFVPPPRIKGGVLFES